MALTKSDLTKIGDLLDKQELKFESKLDNVGKEFESKLDSVEQKFESKLDSVEQKFEEKLVEFKSDFFEKVDPVLKEVTVSREERTVSSEQIRRHDDRITVIEEKLQIKPSLAV